MPADRAQKSLAGSDVPDSGPSLCLKRRRNAAQQVNHSLTLSNWLAGRPAASISRAFVGAAARVILRPRRLAASQRQEGEGWFQIKAATRSDQA